VLSAPALLEKVGGQVGNLDMGGLRKLEVRSLGCSGYAWFGWCWWRRCWRWRDEYLRLVLGEEIVVPRVCSLTFYQVRIIGESVARSCVSGGV